MVVQPRKIKITVFLSFFMIERKESDRFNFFSMFLGDVLRRIGK